MNILRRDVNSRRVDRHLIQQFGSFLDWAADLVLKIHADGIRPPQFGPESGGAVQIDWWGHKGRELELHVQPNGTVEFLRIEGDRVLDEGEFSLRDFPPPLDLINWLTACHD